MKKNSKLVVVVLALLLIAVVALWLLFGKGDKKETSIKIDTEKEYVYNASYKYDNKYTEYKRDPNLQDEPRTIDFYGIPVTDNGNLQSLDKLVVPYININSEDAKKANAELEKLYLDYAKEFDNCKEDLDTTNGGIGMGCSQILTYKTYTYENILSVVVIDSTTQTSTDVFKYHIYNFDLTDGHMLSYGELLTELGYDKKSINDNMNSLIKTKFNEKYNSDIVGDLTKACTATDIDGNPLYDTTNCYDITYKLFTESVSNDSILFFADNDGILNVLIIMYADFVQNGTDNHYLIKVTK